jgi:hypothetical protein
MVEEKRIIVRNIARTIIYPYGEKATNIPSEADLEKNPRLRYTFSAGEQFEIPASKLDSLKRAFPNEIVVGEGLSVGVSDAVLSQKNQEIDRLRAENETLKAENEELKESLEKAKSKLSLKKMFSSKKSEEE